MTAARQMRFSVERQDDGVIRVEVLVDNEIILHWTMNEKGRLIWRAPTPDAMIGPVFLDEVYVSLAHNMQYKVERTDDGIVATPRAGS